MKKIYQTSPNKVRGKLVKYRLGDCLMIHTNNGNYLAVIMTGKFNKYYNLTLLEYYKNEKPQLTEFINGKFFGTRFNSWEDVRYAVDQKMIECKYIDLNPEVNLVGNIILTSNFTSAGYSYFKDIEEFREYYITELPIRIMKSANAEKFPELAFVGKHLVDTKTIIEETTTANNS